MKWRQAVFKKKEFRIIIMKMIQDPEKRMEAKIKKRQEMFTKDLEELKNKQRKIIHSDQIRSVTQLYLSLCNPMDFSSPGSSVHGISQAEEVAGLP